jgi:fluoroacetyl-CoA thioesterase
MVNHQITRGITTTYEKQTTISDAYSSSNTGTLDYLVSTPSIILMIIDAATDMLDKLLPTEYITVGKKIELVHENPSLIGEMITIKLVVEDLTGNSVILNIEAKDSKGLVCSGKYERAIINEEKLLEIAYKRSPDLV